MATHTIKCSCGEHYHVSSEQIGSQIKCRRCGAVIAIRRSTRYAEQQQRLNKQRRRQEILQTVTTRLATIGQHVISWVIPRKRTKFVTPAARYTIIGTWLYLAFAVLLAIILWELGDRWWPATILLFIGRWIFLLPLLALAPLAFALPDARRRRAYVPLIAAAIIIVGPVMGARIGWHAWLPSSRGTPVRVVTFNVETGDPVAALLPIVLDEWNADVVAFQECGPRLQYAIQHLDGWYHHSVRELCFLSRFPIERIMVLDRSGFERLHRDEVAGIGGSGDVVRYRLAMPAGPIVVTNLHLETPRKGLEGLISRTGSFSPSKLTRNTELRDIESHAARGWVDQSTASRIVAGDFNTPVESSIFQEHWGDLVDAFSEVGHGLGMTKYNGWIRVRIDHVLTDSTWQVRNVSIGRDLGSDHRPVIVDLRYHQ